MQGGCEGKWSCPQHLVVFRHSGPDDKAPSFLRVKVILLVCAAVQLLTLCSWWVGKIYAYRKTEIVTQQALLSADYWEDYALCSQLCVKKL